MRAEQPMQKRDAEENTPKHLPRQNLLNSGRQIMEAGATQKRSAKSIQRRALILQVAADIFSQEGYTAASIDMIIDRVGGSKRTIYNEFGNKEGLFTALITEFADDALKVFEAEGQHGAPLPDILYQLAKRLMSAYMSPALLGVYRAMIAEALRFPHLSQAFYERGPGRASADLRKVLESAVARGEIGSIDTQVAADHFIGMVRDNLHLQMVLGLRAAPEPDEVEKAAQSAVDIFLHGVAVTPPRRSSAVAAGASGRRRSEKRRPA
jgi:AcrR family transcriptional regulator